MSDDHQVLRARYEEIAKTGDETTTACDFHLRDLEIDFGLRFIRDGHVVLDVGCGPGVALRRYARERRIEAHGIDYAENMVEMARAKAAESDPDLSVDFRHASVLELPFEDASIDVVTSHRCLMALLDWERQQEALREIHRVLKPGGTLALMEGTMEGLERLNQRRTDFGLDPIAADGRDRLCTLKFVEKDLLAFVDPFYELVGTQRFGMYYFLTRVVQPLLVAPDKPRYDHPLNEIAKQIARVMPDLEGMGHLVGFGLRKRA